ncbi:zf-HC2 domain-containing protein [Actinokineospora terrae]|uniref:Predicted anti-sigma-YlaC factor YlaD, contains Zn-finger domain n=1 Tax=Actinokineospora terrae TaxID=155974 RepID=A0A1H9LHC5_9PSEU|nr:zf-HC2 domain-containing protein [Actinokineospora terrae]SER10794.1 Predicted anti-sigma-YlaC factor YlaD, contains Zn-finger domain [Actinokineospora terrae]
MDCDTCRAALSARLDGEAEPAPAAETDDHLAHCQDCAGWLARAEVLTRSIRVRPAEDVPDLVDAVLAIPSPRGRVVGPRIALAVVALVQLGLALSQLLTGATGGHTEHGMTGHLFNEGAAWNLALGVGLLVAAWQSHRAAGLLPTLAGFVAVLVAFSVHDLVTGSASAERVLSHLPVVVGLALLLVVSRAFRKQPTPGTPVLYGHKDTGTDIADPPQPAPGTKPRHLRPTAKHAA